MLWVGIIVVVLIVLWLYVAVWAWIRAARNGDRCSARLLRDLPSRRSPGTASSNSHDNLQVRIQGAWWDVEGIGRKQIQLSFGDRKFFASKKFVDGVKTV